MSAAMRAKARVKAAADPVIEALSPTSLVLGAQALESKQKNKKEQFS